MGSMPTRISAADVAHVARLARLALTPEELRALYRATRRRARTRARRRSPRHRRRSPTAHPLPLSNVLREDVVVPCLDRDEVLAQAPAVEADRFEVPRILEEAP